MIHNALLILAFICFVILAGLFAGSETGLYRLSRLRLRLGAEKKKLSFVMLNKCVNDGAGLLLSLLIGTNLAHYFATSIITYMLLKNIKTQFFTEIFAVVLTAPVLFIFSELIPKNLFFYRADLLMPYVAPFIYIFHKIFTLSGVIRILKFISSLFTKLAGSASPQTATLTSAAKRHAVQAILQDTYDEGILSSFQTDIINRLVKISSVCIKSIMIPLDKVIKADLNSNNAALINILKGYSYTRLPVQDGQPDNIIGYINIYDALSSSEPFSNLSSFIKPIEHIDAETNVTDAIRFMQSHKQKVLLVVKVGRFGREKPAGIITMKDLVEELFGELAEW
jgi:putative hemolysin